MICLVRVDHRLIHGQVALGWVRTLGCDAILVANDAATTDELLKATLKMAKPAETKLVIKTVLAGAETINAGKTANYRLLVVVATIADAVQLAKNCPEVTSINLGGTRKTPETKQITNTVFATRADLDGLAELAEAGVEIESRVLPGDRKIPWETLRLHLGL